MARAWSGQRGQFVAECRVLNEPHEHCKFLVRRAAGVHPAAVCLTATLCRRCGLTAGIHSKCGQLLLKVLGVALGTLWLLFAKEDSFELVTASTATVLENWHNRSTLEPQQGRCELHNPAGG